MTKIRANANAERFLLRDYRLRKKSLNVWTSESELPVALRAVTVVDDVVASLRTARSREGNDDGGGGADEDGRANIRDARSSYAAWVSRGFWPKRPKAHGAAVDVGNREKGAEEEEDILALRACVCACVVSACCFILSHFLELFQRLGGWVKKKRVGVTCEGHAQLAYIPALEWVGVRRKRIGDTLCSISGIVQFTRDVSRVVRMFQRFRVDRWRWSCRNHLIRDQG